MLLKDRVWVTGPATAAAIDDVSVDGDRYDYLLKYRKKNSIARPFAPDDGKGLEPIAEIVAACDAAAEAALAASEVSGYSREGAFLLAGAWAAHAIGCATAGTFIYRCCLLCIYLPAIDRSLLFAGTASDGEAIVVDEVDPLSAVEAIVKRLCAQTAAAAATNDPQLQYMPALD